MAKRDEFTREETDGRCDIKVWSGSCDHGPETKEPGKYLCSLCETLPGLDHEVRHEIFPHVSGDYDRMM
jgi:hypothetical protein